MNEYRDEALDYLVRISRNGYHGKGWKNWLGIQLTENINHMQKRWNILTADEEKAECTYNKH